MPYSERIRPNGLSIFESLRGSSPPIDFLCQDFSDQLAAIQSPDQRMAKAVERVEYWRAKARVDFTHDSGLINPPVDVMAVLFLDSINHLSRDTIYKNSLQNSKRRLDIQNEVNDLGNSYRTLQEHIGDYVRIFEGVPGDLKYEGLDAIMYEAGCLIYGQEEITNSEDLSRKLLIGLLAEHKVLTALKEEGWELAFYSSVERDTRFKSDITVPVGDWRTRETVDLQVKALPRPEHKLDIWPIPHSYRLLCVEVPMHRIYDQFSLSDQEKVHLKHTIHLAVSKAAV